MSVMWWILLQDSGCDHLGAMIESKRSLPRNILAERRRHANQSSAPLVRDRMLKSFNSLNKFFLQDVQFGALLR